MLRVSGWVVLWWALAVGVAFAVGWYVLRPMLAARRAPGHDPERPYRYTCRVPGCDFHATSNVLPALLSVGEQHDATHERIDP